MNLEGLAECCEADALEEAYADFLRTHSDYSSTLRLDWIRRSDYSRLDRLGQVYLDYTGSGQYADSQLDAHLDLLRSGAFGNPHSDNPTSSVSTRLVEEARREVLHFFNAAEDEYEVVFTQNATGALKLVGEAYPFQPGDQLLLTYDNHNSVNGIREFARRKGANVSYVSVTDSDLRLDLARMRRALRETIPGRRHLFAYPAQSNFSGVQHPLSLVEEARERGWNVVLDAAAFVPTNRLDLAIVHPDFVTISFYKMFGYPTGIGALLARREALDMLVRPWFAGGTITMASVHEGWYRLAAGPAGFEDGTVNFLGIPAVTVGLRHLSSIGMDLIHQRVNILASWLLEILTGLRHSNGSPLAAVYGPCTMEERGGTIAFLLLDPDGEPFDVPGSERLAAARNMSLRTGCFCNPGDGEVAHRLTRDDVAVCFFTSSQVTFDGCTRTIRETSGKTPNTLRVSLGLVSNFEDVFRFAQFLMGFRDRPAWAPLF